MHLVRQFALGAAALLVAGAASAAVTFTYDFSLRATTPNPQVPGSYQPFGFTTATPPNPFQAVLQYEVDGGNNAQLTNFAATVGNQSWTESPQQVFSPTLNPDGTLQSLFFRADSDGDAFDSSQWQNIIGIFINFGGSTFWRAFETNCQVSAVQVSLSCIQGTEADNGISWRITQSGSVPEPATLWLALPALLCGARFVRAGGGRSKRLPPSRRSIAAACGP